MKKDTRKKKNTDRVSKDEFRKMTKSLIEEADFDSGGLLPPLDALAFVDLIEEISTFKQYCTLHPFTRQKMNLTSIDMNNRALKKKVEATKTTIRRKPTITQKVLQPIRFIAPIELSGESLEVNFEEGSFADHVMRLVATVVSKDLDELILMGDTKGVLGVDTDDSTYEDGKYIKDPFLNTMNGVFKKGIAAGSVYDASGHTLTYFNPGIAAGMKLAIPKKRRRSIPGMKFFVSWEAYTDYCMSLVKTGKDYETIQQYLTAQNTPYFQGIPIWPLDILDAYPKMSVVDSVLAGGTIDIDYPPVEANSLKVTRDDITDYTDPYELTTDYTFDETTGLWTHVSDGGIPTGVDLNLTYGAAPMALLINPANVHLGVAVDDMKLKMREDIEADTIYIVVHTRIGIEVLDLDALMIGTKMTTRAYEEWSE